MAKGPQPAIAASKLPALLRSLRQGDVISLGAVSLVGQGPSEALRDVPAPVASGPGELWSVTVESDVGWYVIVSQDCDIVRDVADEPCLLVSPLKYVSAERWSQLRHGPYSPMEFPYPEDKIGPTADGAKPVVDARFFTSVDKNALLEGSVATLRPLTGPQQERFQSWLGRRFARLAHDYDVEECVLRPAAAALLGYLKTAQKAQADGKAPTASGQVMLAAEEWFVGGTDKLISLHVITSTASVAATGTTVEVLESGRSFIEGKLRAKLPAGKGYGLSLNLWTLDAMPASTYRDLAEWTFEPPGDPLDV